MDMSTLTSSDQASRLHSSQSTRFKGFLAAAVIAVVASAEFLTISIEQYAQLGMTGVLLFLLFAGASVFALLRLNRLFRNAESAFHSAALAEKELYQSATPADEALSDMATTALAAINANVMIADQSNTIVYMNEAVKALFARHEKKIREQIPEFDASSLIGTSMDVFHKNPAHQRRLIDALQETYSSSATVAGITFTITASPIFDADARRTGTVVEWEDISLELEARQQAQENSRLRQALDRASANIMVADEHNCIIYMNDTVRRMFLTAADDIRQDLPDFRVDQLIGQSMDVFHKQPEHQRKLIENLTEPYTAPAASVGSRTFSITASPIFGTDKDRLGTVVEWSDKTAELAVENEVNSIVASARSGDLGKRIRTEDKSGFFKVLSAGINELVTVCDQVVSDTGAVLSALAQGNLDTRIDRDYEGAFQQLKRDANTTVERLIEVIGDIQRSAQSVSTGADEISKGNLNLSQRTEEQSASLEETASSMEEMTSTVQQNADNAKQATQLAASAKEKAEFGGDVVSRAVQAMAEIEQSSKEVSAILSVIDDIAYQTNLLALNASVEAARAGEQGKGFAVVAEEVRALAQRSAAAAKDIKTLISSSVNKVTDGSELVNSSGATLEEIINAVNKVNSIVSEISVASVQQANGIEEVNRAISQMDEITQQNAALVEESAAAAQNMSDQAQGLSRLISFFKV